MFLFWFDNFYVSIPFRMLSFIFNFVSKELKQARLKQGWNWKFKI